MIEQALCPVLVGRDDELAALEDGLVAAARRQGHVYLVSADAGLGKTRLATELMRRASRIGFRWIWGGCSESDIALPYLPFLEAVGNYLAESDTEALRAELGRSASALGQLFPQFEDAVRGGEADDPSQSKLRLYEAMVALLHALAEERGLLFVVEDLHWADGSTRELLDYVARRIRGSRVLVLGTYRRDEMHRKHPLVPMLQSWRRAGLAEVIELQPLEADALERMIGAIFDREVTQDFRALLFERTEGNPFVLEEMLKEAIDRGDVFRTTGGRWERKEISDIRIPQSVAEGILLRVERLDAGHADALRAAAVLGRSFDYPILAAITGLPEAVVLEAVRQCVRQQLIEADPQAPGRYRFRHALTRESVYEDLIEPERRRLHAAAADALAGDASIPAAELAHHLFAAGRFADAVPLALRAAEEASRRFGFREALAQYERALPHISDPVERGRTLCAVGEVRWNMGETPRAITYLTEGIPILESEGRITEAAHFRVWLGRCHWEQREPVRAREQYEAAKSVFEPLGPSYDLAHVLVRLSGLHAFECEADACDRLAREARRIALEAGAVGPRVLAEVFIGVADVLRGRITDGLAAIDRAAREGSSLDLGWVVGNAAANACIFRFGPLRAVEVADVVTLVRRTMADTLQRDASAAFLEGTASFLLGEIPVAVEQLVTARGLLSSSLQLFYAWSETWLSEAYAELQRFDDARRHFLDPGTAVHREELLWFTARALRVLTALQEPERAVELARIAAMSPTPIDAFREVVPEVVRVLVDAGDPDAAEAFLDDTGPGGPEERAYMERARGILALARADAADAAASLRRAAEAFAAAGYRIDEMYARCELARALATSGDAEAARAELCSVLATARHCGSLYQEDRARGLAKEFGAKLAEPEEARPPAAPARTADLRDAAERLVTVMFADVRGYTALTVQTPPPELAERLGSFHRWAQREIERRRGLVDKFAGDAVMATFNASATDLDHCRHAFEAGMALQERAGFVGLPVGVGIACGPAVVGTLARGANVSVLGETTNLAARLQTQAGAGEIVLSEEAYRRLRLWLDETTHAVERVSLELKGFEGPIGAYVVRPVTAGRETARRQV